MGFQKYLNEKNINALWQDVIANEIDIAKQKHFKKAHVEYQNGVLGDSTMFAKLYLVGDENDQPHKNFRNDCLGLSIMIEKIGDDEYEVEYDQTNISIKPSNPHMAFGSHKVRTRKYKGDVKKISVNTDKIFAKYKEELYKLNKDAQLKLPDEIINKYL